jgi:hypothetical protein
MTNLEAAAKFLGSEYSADRQGIWRKTDAPDWASQTLRVSDDELCMALFRKFAEIGSDFALEYYRQSDFLIFTSTDEPAVTVGRGPTPLTAVLAAVAALEGV